MQELEEEHQPQNSLPPEQLSQSVPWQGLKQVDPFPAQTPQLSYLKISVKENYFLTLGP
jgi:hypothetical protein